MTTLNWRISFSTSALHASQALSSGWTQTDTTLGKSLGSASQALHRVLVDCLGQPIRRGWQQLLGLSSEIESNRELAERWLRRMGLAPNPSLALRLSGAIADVEAGMRLASPTLTEQLTLRGRPLQEQWLGFGRGLMAHLRRLTEEDWLVPSAEVILLQPVLGGAGHAFPTMNRLAVEAVLTNPMVELPEVVRVAWLASQLHADLPRYADGLTAGRAEPIVALASLPAVLAAAEVMELAKCDEATIQLAVENWQLAVPPLDRVAGVLIPWWETYLQTRPEWSIALRALDKMLDGQLEWPVDARHEKG